MIKEKQQTLFALDCGATNWRLYRCAYQWNGTLARLMGEPQASPLTSFSDRKLPAVLSLNPSGAALEGYGESAQQLLENEQARERVREYFKPCIGAHLEKKPLPHQKRYTHAQALQYTCFLLTAVLEQIRKEKWRGEPFDDRLWFSFAYPIHWQYDHNGVTYKEFRELVKGCLGKDFNQIRFVAEPEGAILSLQHSGVLEKHKDNNLTLIIDVGGSTTDIIAGEVDQKSGRLNYLGRYGEPFGGGLYDAELAKYIADELNIPASALADDPTALVSLRVSGQRLKESLSRQVLSSIQDNCVHQRTVTLVMRDGSVHRRLVTLDQAGFHRLTDHLDQDFKRLVNNSLETIAIAPSKIHQVVLVGGGAQLFTIMNYLRELFGEDRVLLADNPDEVVVRGIGLEYQASFEDTAGTIVFPPQINPENSTQKSVFQPSPWHLKQKEEQVQLPIGITRLGRSQSSDLQVDDLKASRLHAELSASQDTLELADKGSTNGTYVNDQRIKSNEPVPLKPDDVIGIGKARFVVTKK
ncbi:MAG: FHA domain-containing protein [Anaerolineales bacterium]|nr:FHA domain-containing protein [Anaerolineales bacterium]